MHGTMYSKAGGAISLPAGRRSVLRVLGARLPRRWPMRLGAVVGLALAGFLLLAGSGLRPGPQVVCGCVLPPIPNLLALEVGGRFFDQKNYQAAAGFFDDLLRDPNSAAIYAEALYGRGLSRSAMGQKDAGTRDMDAARKLKADVAYDFERSVIDPFRVVPRPGLIK
ncbi:MAG TPA: hypothetical protein VKV77_09935 [Methylovirgula sp.]|nr:hypothetical protein [Methylovirgula sp.]